MTRWRTLLWMLGLLFLGSARSFGIETSPAREPVTFMVAPFVLLLLAIALMPFIHKHHWENHYPKISVALGAVTVLYYVFHLHNGPRMLTSLVEYVGFMALIGSLFVVSGGIHIQMAGRSTPMGNTVLLAVGALLANVIGTTGASMLMIRPFLRVNKHRVSAFHVVFFIFLVSNIGGALTPIGDPPLFLGYLKGVPFLWLLGQPRVLAAWLVCVGALLVLFYVLDRRQYQKHPVETHPPAPGRVRIEGAHNFLFLVLLIGLVLVQKAGWLAEIAQRPLFVAMGESLGWGAQKSVESFITVIVGALMVGVACVSYRFSNRDALRENEFTFGPIREVGFLFIGIFATMVPALDLLEVHAADLGITTARQYFWGSGALSSVLDNAPTYLNFLTAAFGLKQLSLENPAHVQSFLADPSAWDYLIAVSLGSVFFGANTYIGNGPNFMVKSIAESSGVRCPSFFEYIFKYSLPILIPLFAIVSFVVLR